ncbi:MAG: prepilin-type N-terminal cleavage/methylation domain-containing protein [Candidatus Omnitrophota bacterium]|nr:prepilin-type N-terminal cleavage/methylation domain-containing protein [Candidatus Omnitrophota bacterium]
MRQPGLLMRLSDKKGFTLPELLLAAVILVFVLTGLLALFINCTFLNEANRNLATAGSHAQYVMEDIRAAGFVGLEARVNDNNGTPLGWDLNSAQIQSEYNLTPLTGETINTSVIQSGNPVGVSVRISWNDSTGRPRERELQTLITDY